MGAPLAAPALSLTRTARGVYQAEGLLGFCEFNSDFVGLLTPGHFIDRGFAPIVLRAFPVNACAFLVYESLMRTLGAETVSNDMIFCAMLY
jgi:hypothetical protein